MQLSAWLREQIAVNGGVLHVCRDGVEVLVDLEEIAGELDRRLVGLSYSPRIIATSHSAVETLSIAQANDGAAAEMLRQSCITVAHAVVELGKGDKRGRPSIPRAKIMDQMTAGINAEKYTWEQLQGASQRWIKDEFGCHHNTYWKALAQINLANSPVTG